MSVDEDDRKLPSFAPPESQGDGSGMDGILLEEGYDDEGVGPGLKLDDAQAAEIRQVFLTTLPQYLEPVEQMIEQLAGSDDSDDATQKALDTTLGSISAAATRIDISDVAENIERMRERVAHLDAGILPREDVIAELQEGLAAIRNLVADDGLPAAAATDATDPGASKTLVAAFEGIEGIDRSVLEKLIAAGVINVAQLEMARPDELVAVSGLDRAVIDRLLDALVRSAPDSARATAAESARFREQVLAAADGPDDASLKQRVLDQIEGETGLDELRVEVLRLRLKASKLRADVVTAERERDELYAQLSAMRDRLAERLEALSVLRTRRDRVERGLVETETVTAREKERLTRLREREEATRATEEADRRKLLELQEVVARLLDATPGGSQFSNQTNKGGGRAPPDAV